ncbi:MAG: conjugal transfer protein TraA [Gammaproteobacteria bacterium]|nr:conjugal transfer protein TraA [Gammaproteobacteria bacterium]
MAVYRLSAKVIGRNAGRSVTAAAAYRAGECIEDERTGLAHDYRRRTGVEHVEILAPDNAPEWMRDRAKLWNAVELIEKRKDAQLARELQLALPCELDASQNLALVRGFVREQCVAHGMVADIAIHSPDREGDERNWHAHVLLTMRDLLGDGFGKKNRAWNESARLEDWREKWAEYQNRALERAGSKERVDHRSLEARGIDREAEPKLGPHASEMERRGKASDRGDERRAVWRRNQRREQLERRAEVIDLAAEREKRRAEAVLTREQAEAERIERDALAGIAAEEARHRDEAQRPRLLDPNARPLSVSRRAFEEQKHAAALSPEAFKAWAREKRQNLARAGEHRLVVMQLRHARERRDLADRLDLVYGPRLAEDRAALHRLEERIARGGFFYRLTRARRDRESAEALRANIADAQARRREQERPLEIRQEDEARAIEREQRNAAERLDKRLAVLEQKAVREPANDRKPAETTLERIRRERLAAQENDRQAGRDFDMER